MKLKIISVHGHGNVEEEYVLLRATEDCDLGYYLLSDSTYTEAGKVSNKVRHTRWLPGREIKKGEYVAIYTKVGTTSKSRYNGHTLHNVYWGLKAAVWNDDGDCAVLMQIQTWQFFNVHGE